MSEHPIQGLMKTAMESLKSMVDVGTVVGQAVETKDGTLVIPVSAVSFGFAAGGSEFGAPRRSEEGASHPFGGGSGAGVSVRPVGFLVVHRDQVRMLPVDEGAAIERLIDAAPDVLDRLRALWNDRLARNDGHAAREAAETLERAGLSIPSRDGGTV
jgi:sporulation protein YtfJ